MLCALKELKVNEEYVHGCDVSGYDVLVLSWSRRDSVCTLLLLSTMYVKFLGSGKECILANIAVPNAGHAKLAAWDELLVASNVSSSLFSQKSPKFSFVVESS